MDQLSQFCAGYFDDPSPAEAGLYAAWRQASARDRRPTLLMGLAGFAEAVQRLPSTPVELIGAALDALRLPAPRRRGYLSALLLDINGWASCCARRRREARLAGRPEVRRLADNGWLHLFRIDREAGRIRHYHRGGWHPAPRRPPAGVVTALASTPARIRHRYLIPLI